MSNSVEVRWPPRPMGLSRWASAVTETVRLAESVLGVRGGGWLASLGNDTGATTYSISTLEQVVEWVKGQSPSTDVGDKVLMVSWMSDDLTAQIQIAAGNKWRDNWVRLLGMRSDQTVEVLLALARAWIAEWGYATTGPSAIGPSRFIFGDAVWVRSWRLLHVPHVPGFDQSEHLQGMLWTLQKGVQDPAGAVTQLMEVVDRADVLIPFWPRAWPMAQALSWYRESAGLPDERMTWEGGQVQFHGLRTENGRPTAVMVLSSLWSWYHYDISYEAWNNHFIDAARIHDAVSAERGMGVRWILAQGEVATATQWLLRRFGLRVDVSYERPIN